MCEKWRICLEGGAGYCLVQRGGEGGGLDLVLLDEAAGLTVVNLGSWELLLKL